MNSRSSTLEADEEHQQELAQFGEEGRDRALLGEDADRMRPDQDAAEDVADDRRQPQAVGEIGHQ
jgi:hypothetical protein